MTIIQNILRFRRQPNYKQARENLLAFLENNGSEDLESWLSAKEEKGYSRVALHRMVFTLLKDSHMSEAVKYGEKVVYFEKDPKFMRVLATRHKWLGNIERYNQLLQQIIKIENHGGFTEIVAKLEQAYDDYGMDKAEAYISVIIAREPVYKNALYKKLFTIAKDKDTRKALKYAEEVLTGYSDAKFVDVVVKRYEKIGQHRKARILGSKTGKTKLTLTWFKSELLSVAEESDAETTEEFIRSCQPHFDNDPQFEKQVFAVLKDLYTELAVDYGLNYYEATGVSDIKFAAVLALRTKRIGRYQEALSLYKDLYRHDENELYISKIIKLIGLIHKDEIKQDIAYGQEGNAISRLTAFLPDGFQNKEKVINKIVFEAIKTDEKSFQKAVDYAIKYLEVAEDPHIALSLSNLYFMHGYIDKALSVPRLDYANEKHKIKMDHYRAYKNLLENGFPMPEPVEAPENAAAKKNVLYCLHNTLPYNSGGYATRSHGLAKGVQLSGWNIKIASRLGYPNDLSSFRNNEQAIEKRETIEGIDYHRLSTDINQYGVAPLDVYLREYGEALYSLAKELDISMLHGASNFMNGIAANYAARKLGIKSVYEVRGLWEVTRMSRQPEWEGSEHFNMIRRLETEAALNADAVLTITQALKDEMVSRGVPASKITVVSNGVHVDRFVPKERSGALEDALGYKNKTVIGFIGSVVSYEGLEYLVEAAQLLKEWGTKDFAVMIVGDGAVWEEIKQLSKELGVDNLFTFTGRVPHEEVEDYYSLVDIAPFPRKGLPVCEMVSPLKPFEAMSMGKAVLSSNVAALAEIVDDGNTGLLFEKDNVEDFARTLLRMIEDKDLREQLGSNARKWVEEEKDWKILSNRVSKIYKHLIQE